MNQSLRDVLPLLAPLLLIVVSGTESITYLPLNISGENVLLALYSVSLAIAAGLALLQKPLPEHRLPDLRLALTITAVLSGLELFLAVTSYRLPAPSGWISMIKPICLSGLILFAFTPISQPTTQLSTGNLLLIALPSAALISSISLFFPDTQLQQGSPLYNVLDHLSALLLSVATLLILLNRRWLNRQFEYLLLSALLIMTTAHWLFTSAAPGATEGQQNLHLLLTTISLTIICCALAMELQRQQEPAEAPLSQEEFITLINHEIRTPLNVISGVSELLNSSALSRSQHQQINILQHSGFELKQLLDNTQDLVELRSGKLALHQQPFDLQAELQRLLIELKPAADQKGIILKGGFSPSAPTMIVSDKRRIKQVLSFLLERCLEYSQRGEISLLVECGEDKMLQVSIQDCSDSFAPLHFNAKTSDQAPAPQRPGNHIKQLQLSVCYGLIKRLGGTLEFHQQRQRPQRFLLKLPLQPGREEEPAQQLSGHSLLLISNLGDFDHYKLLQAVGAQVSKLDLTRHLLTQLSTTPSRLTGLGLIVVYHRPPENDGFKFIAELKQAYPDTPPIMLLSFQYSGDDFKRARDAGAYCYARLPIPNHEFLSLAELCLSSYPEDKSDRPLITARSHQQDFSNPAARLNGHVLVAEDIEANRFVVCAMLENLGLRYSIAENGVEAIEQWLRQKPDLILMDLQMPVMDGFEASRQIRAQEQQPDNPVPIIALTADAMSDSYHKARKSGISDMLIKPLDKLSLSRILNQYLPDMEVANPRATENSTASAPQPQTEAPMDINVLEELSRNVQLPVDQLAGVYLSELAGLRQALDDGIAAGDTDVVHRTAHSIKGAALSIGATELATIAREIEASSLETIQLNALDNAYTEMQQQIEQYLGHQPIIG